MNLRRASYPRMNHQSKIDFHFDCVDDCIRKLKVSKKNATRKKCIEHLYTFLGDAKSSLEVVKKSINSVSEMLKEVNPCLVVECCELLNNMVKRVGVREKFSRYTPKVVGTLLELSGSSISRISSASRSCLSSILQYCAQRIPSSQRVFFKKHLQFALKFSTDDLKMEALGYVESLVGKNRHRTCFSDTDIQGILFTIRGAQLKTSDGPLRQKLDKLENILIEKFGPPPASQPRARRSQPQRQRMGDEEEDQPRRTAPPQPNEYGAPRGPRGTTNLQHQGEEPLSGIVFEDEVPNVLRGRYAQQSRDMSGFGGGSFGAEMQNAQHEEGLLQIRLLERQNAEMREKYNALEHGYQKLSLQIHCLRSIYVQKEARLKHYSMDIYSKYKNENTKYEVLKRQVKMIYKRLKRHRARNEKLASRLNGKDEEIEALGRKFSYVAKELERYKSRNFELSKNMKLQ